MPLTPAKLGERPLNRSPGIPYSPQYQDLYHSEAGAWAQAEQVFMLGNDLPARWRGRDRFVILETGFGLGNNFLVTWAAWRRDPERCQRLVFISIEKHPLLLDDLRRVHAAQAATGDDDDHAQVLADRLIQAWPPLTPGLHTLDFDEPAFAGASDSQARVSLLLGLGDVADLLPALVASVDAFYLDGFAPSRNPDMWDAQWLSRLGRWAAPGATVATWSVARPLRDALEHAGFKVSRERGFGSKRDRISAVYSPRFKPPPLPGGLWPAPAPPHRHALVIGAGLAGCAAAWALTREGWQVTLIDRHDGPAAEASGNPGGLFHGVVHGDDGLHARALRVAALHAFGLLSRWTERGEVPGACHGLLRLDDHLDAEQAMAMLNRLGLPPDHVRWVDRAEAQSLSGLAVPSGGWWFAQAGWVSPSAYARALLAQAQCTGLLKWHGGACVDRLERDAANQWQALDAKDTVLAQAGHVVLAQSLDVPKLLANSPALAGCAMPPLSASRGQITAVDVSAHPSALLPRIPVAGSGYVVALDGKTLLCGATSHLDDWAAHSRAEDHSHNLGQAHRLGALPDSQALPGLDAKLTGRVGWRASTPDRLPMVGALPLKAPPGVRAPDQPRRIARLRDERSGVYLMTGLGSRGITWSALAGRLLAHWVTGAPCPVEADLRDALDPARFEARQARAQSRKAT